MGPHFCTTKEMSSCEFRMILGLPLCKEDNQVANNKSYEFCKIPSQYVGIVKKTLKCDLFKKYNRICSKNITLALTDLSPYVEIHKDGTSHGLLIRKFAFHFPKCIPNI